MNAHLRIAASTLIALATAAAADDRLFTFSYQATTVPAGKVEFENWVTFKEGTPADSSSRRAEFRHEIEFGLTDHVQLDVYLADWSWTHAGHDGPTDLAYDDSAATIKINYLDPTTDGFGLASYHEVKLGPDVFELENKLLLQKNIQRFVLVYNLTLEAAWEDDGYTNREGELSQSAGVSYEFTPAFFMGAELLHEIPMPDWTTGGPQNVYIGPNLSYRFGGEHDWYITATVLRQVTPTEDEATWQFRMIVGFTF